MMLTIKQAVKLSAVIDKLELKVTDPKASAEQVGADLLLQAVSRLHLAEKELYAFISEVKRISEDEAANVDAWEFVKELFSDPKVRPFFSRAAKLAGLE